MGQLNKYAITTERTDIEKIHTSKINSTFVNYVIKKAELLKIHKLSAFKASRQFKLDDVK